MPKQSTPRRLWRISLNRDGDVSETALILFAPDETSAMRDGLERLEDAITIRNKAAQYEPEDDDDPTAPFYSCEEIKDADDLEAALDGIPAIGDLTAYTGGIASVTWPPVLEHLAADRRRVRRFPNRRNRGKEEE